MKNRVLSFVPLALVIVIALIGASACTRAKPNRPVASAPTSSPLPEVTTPAETPAVPATQVAAAPVTSTTAPIGNVTPIPLEPSPTMVPGMPTATVNPPAPADNGPAAAVTLIVPLTPAVESTPIPAPGQPQAQQANAAGVPTKAYKIKEADTLFGIAVRFGTTVETLKQLNNLTGDMLTVGQELLVPATPNPTPEAELAAPAAPAAPAAVAPAAPAVSARTAPAGSRVHVVKPGENLFRIALKYGVSLEAMAEANGIVAPWYTIYVGQRLSIP